MSYRRPDPFSGQRVVIVGGGNSAAQILAEVSRVADDHLGHIRPPRFLPDDVDGRVLFATARARLQALSEGREHAGASQGSATSSWFPRSGRPGPGVLNAQPMFARLTPTGVAWEDGTERRPTSIIWCTGFGPTCATSTHST